MAAGLAGADAGGIAGGMIGVLIGSGIPEDRVKLYEKGIKNGHVVLGVHPSNAEDAAYISEHWKANKGEEVYS